jgi:hypothetical protein
MVDVDAYTLSHIHSTTVRSHHNVASRSFSSMYFLVSSSYQNTLLNYQASCILFSLRSMSFIFLFALSK